MADIVFHYTQMQKCVTDIQQIAAQYKTAAATLQSDFTSAISGWEGSTKDKVNTFMTGAVNNFTGTDIPNLLNGLASILQANIDQMQKADNTLAENIPTTL